jgi:RNA polymerase sigma factor (sigma-70 family)
MLPPFSVFLEEHRDAVYRYLWANVGPNEVDDCFQETFLSALRAYPRLAEDSNLTAWVLRIAERKAIDAHRARARAARPEAEPPDGAETGGDQVVEPRLWSAVRRLPSKQRAAVVHRFVNDLRYADIGEAIGCTEEAARQNVRAGLRNLRKEWVT